MDTAEACQESITSPGCWVPCLASLPVSSCPEFTNHAQLLLVSFQGSCLPEADQWTVRTYQAQALCGLDRADEAAACLATALETSTSIGPPQDAPDLSGSQVWSNLNPLLR